MKKLASLFLGITSVFVLGNVALAAEFLTPSQDGDGSVVMTSKQELKNLYSLGTYVTLNGKVLGDLFALGSQVAMEGEVEADANVVGAMVNLNGPMGQDLRLASSLANINNKVGGDALVAGGDVVFTEKSSVLGSVYVASDSLKLSGPVEGSLNVRAKRVLIDSKINGDVNVSNAEQVVFGSKAEVLGKVKVSSKQAPEIREGASVPNVEFESLKNSGMKMAVVALLSGWFFVTLFSFALAAWVILRLAPNMVKESLKHWKASFLKNFGVGCLVLVVVPLAMFLGFVSLVGMYLSVIGLLLYLLLLVLAYVQAGIFVGAWLMMKYNKASELEYSWRAILLGVFALGLVGLIPVVGGLFSLVITLFILGSIVTNIWERIRINN